MPTTQKPQQKQTKATQKVGGSAKKPVTKAMEGGKGKVAAVKSKATTRGGSAKGGSFYNYEETKERSIKNEKDIIELNKKISNISNINQDISNINQDISNINQDITDLKLGLKLKGFYINAILGKYFNTEELKEIHEIVAHQIKNDNTQTENNHIHSVDSPK